MNASPSPFIAVDLGAESARVMAGTVTDSTIAVEEKIRRDNRPVPLPDRLAWDIAGLFDTVLDGIAAVPTGRSIGIDGWGVDVGLIRSDGSLCGQPRCYRDPITGGTLPALWERIEPSRLYARTGIQMLEINTLVQLLSWKLAGLRELDDADKFVLLPDLLSHWLGGDIIAERTNASTTQLLGINGAWDEEIFGACGLAFDLCPPLVDAGTVIGRLRPALGERTQSSGMNIVAVASHDTASAVAGTPLGPTSAYISSGTWSLVGLEVATPVLSEQARHFNLSNERGADGTFRLLRNVMGMWLIQRCRAAWAAADEAAIEYPTLLEWAAASQGFRAVVDPDDDRLLRAHDVPGVVSQICTETDQRAPETRGGLLRCLFESLALRYRWTLGALAGCSGRAIGDIHIVGGGSQNELLCNMTASATGLPVYAGPVEAAALGNTVIQAIADGTLSTIADGRRLIEISLPSRLYEPVADDRWDRAFDRFCNLPSLGAPPNGRIATTAIAQDLTA
jgi:rhamnulokinase